MDNWKHAPDSPWGDVDICYHGCTRPHDSTKQVCIICDYPADADIKCKRCDICDADTWHLDDNCLACKKEVQ